MNFFKEHDEEPQILSGDDNDPQDSSKDTKDAPPASGQEDALEEPVQDYKDLWLRAVAENENLCRRHQKEKTDVAQYAAFGIAKDLLSVVDNFQRALAVDLQDSSDTVQPLLEGIQITYKELMTVLGKFGVEKIKALGMDFDPHLHQAIGEEVSHHHAPGKVTQVLQDGYILKERLLRPTLVMLAKAPL